MEFLKRNKSILQLSGANFLVLALPTLLLPVFSRLYTVADFAQFGIYTTIISLLLPVLNLHFQQAIPVPTETRRVNALTQLCVLLLFILTSILSLAWYFFPGFRALFDPEDLMAGWYFLIPVGLLVLGLGQILQHWILQGHHFAHYAKSRSLMAISQSLLRYFAAFTAYSGGLMWSFIGGNLTQLLVFGSRFKPGKRESWIYIKETALLYISFLKFGLPSTILFALSNFLPLILLAHYFQEEVVGQFSMALRIGSIPIFLLATAFGQVFFAECRKAPERTAELCAAFLKKGLNLTGYAIVVLIFIAKPLGLLLLGAEWAMAIDMVLVFVPALWLNFLMLPLTNLFEIKNRQDLGFYYALVALVFRLAPIAIALQYITDPVLVLLIMGIGVLISNIFGFFICQKMVVIPWFRVIKERLLVILLATTAITFYFLFLY